jgi:hypothetical protein
MVDAGEMVGVDSPMVVGERLEAFAGGVLAEATEPPGAGGQRRLYLGGLIEQGCAQVA